MLRMTLYRCLALVAALGASLGLAGGRVSAAAPAQGCGFVLGFAALQQAISSTVGSCTEDQRFAANGDAQQHTTGGLMVWRKADNWTAFTNGYETWIAGPTGVARRFNDEWFEFESYPAVTDGVPVDEAPMTETSPTEVGLGPLIHTDQTLDNCGPASIAEVLRYYGVTKSQQELQAILRPDNPQGMATEVVAPFARSIGFRAVVTQGATDKQLKALLRAGVPPIVEDTVSASDGKLHYRAVEAYDDARSRFIAADTLLGPRHAISYAEFDQIWSVTQRTLVVLYPPGRQAAVDSAMSAGR